MPTNPTTHTARSGAARSLTVVPAAGGGVAISAPVADVAALLAHLHATGATVTPTPARDAIVITLPAAPALPAPAAGRSRQARAGRVLTGVTWRHTGIALAVLSALAVIAGTAFLIATAIAWVAAHLAAIGAVVLALVVLAAVAGTTACTTTVRITHHH